MSSIVIVFSESLSSDFEGVVEIVGVGDTFSKLEDISSLSVPKYADINNLCSASVLTLIVFLAKPSFSISTSCSDSEIWAFLS